MHLFISNLLCTLCEVVSWVGFQVAWIRVGTIVWLTGRGQRLSEGTSCPWGWAGPLASCFSTLCVPQSKTKPASPSSVRDNSCRKQPSSPFIPHSYTYFLHLFSPFLFCLFIFPVPPTFPRAPFSSHFHLLSSISASISHNSFIVLNPPHSYLLFVFLYLFSYASFVPHSLCLYNGLMSSILSCHLGFRKDCMCLVERWEVIT